MKPPICRHAPFLRVLWILLASMPAILHATPSTRSYIFAYYAEIPARPVNGGVVDIVVPLAVSDAYQSVLNREVRSEIPGKFEEDVQGNLYWHGRSEPLSSKPLKVQINYVVRRRGFDGGELQTPIFTFTPEDEEFPARNLEPRAGIRRGGSARGHTRAAEAIRLFEHFIDSSECRAGSDGCPPGRMDDSFVEFLHASSVTARVECGVRVPPTGSSGELNEPLCWTAVFLPGPGWVPVDITAACGADQANRGQFFAVPATDRIRMAMPVGLPGDDEDGYAPLRPRVESAGKQIKGVKTRVYYREVRPTTTAVR